MEDLLKDSSIFLDINHIRKEVEAKAMVNDGLIIDSLIQYCEENNIDIETVSIILKTDPIFILRLKEEAEDLHLIKKDKGSTLEEFMVDSV